MGNKEPIIILAILFGIIILLIVPSIPFTESQFYKQATDLNYSKVQEGDYNNRVLVFDGNKISVADANDLNVALHDLTGFVKLDQTIPQTTVGRFTFPDLTIGTNTIHTSNGNVLIGTKTDNATNKVQIIADGYQIYGKSISGGYVGAGFKFHSNYHELPATTFLGNFGDYGTSFAQNRDPATGELTDEALFDNSKAVNVAFGNAQQGNLFSIYNYPSNKETARFGINYDGDVGIGGAMLTRGSMTGANLIVKQNGNVLIGTSTDTSGMKLKVNGKILAQDKIAFTQTDGKEYIDSLNDGYMDYGATTAHRFNNTLVSKGKQIAVVTKTANYTATVNDELIVCNSTTAFTITLPVATGSGQMFNIKNINTGVITIEANGSETIDGELTQSVSQWSNISVVDNASGTWVII